MWNIVTDSSCDDMNFEHSLPEIHYTRVPFLINTDSREYVDDGSVDIQALMADMKHSKVLKTACPSPASWHEAFSRPGDTYAFTISAALSGSFDSACTAKHMTEEEQPDKSILVVNTKGTGPTQILMIRMLTRMIEEGLDRQTIKDRLTQLVEKIRIVFALNSFDNLIRNGRMSRLAGFMAHRLGFWGVGTTTPDGKIQVLSKVRGTRKALAAILEDIKARGSSVSEVVICHCLNSEAAEELKAMVLETFRNIRVDIFQTGGLDSFYAEKAGLIVSYL